MINKSMRFLVPGFLFMSVAYAEVDLYSVDATKVQLYGNIQVRYEHSSPRLSNKLKEFNTEHEFNEIKMGGVTPGGATISGQRVNSLFNTTLYDGRINKILADDSHLGLEVRQELEDDFYARGVFELGWEDMASPNTEEGTGSKLRMNYGYIAVGSEKYGELKLGKMASVQDAIGKKHDFSQVLAGGSVPTKNWQATDKADNAAGYQWQGYGVTVMLQGQGETGKYDAMTVGSLTLIEKPKIDSGLGGGVNWVSNFGLSVSGTYTHVALQKEKKEHVLYSTKNAGVDRMYSVSRGAKIKSDSMSFAMAYTFSNITLGATIAGHRCEGNKAIRYTETINNVLSTEKHRNLSIKQLGLGLGARYAFSNTKFRVYGMYDQLETKYDTENALQGAYAPYTDSPNKKHKEKYTMVTLGLDYLFVEQLLVYFECGHKKITGVYGMDSSDLTVKANLATVGMRFYF